MRITLKTLVILLLAALMPLRAVAAVTIGLCAAGHDETAIAAHADSGHGSGAHEHHSGDSPAKSATPSCSACVEHCSGAAFAPSAEQALSAPAVAQDRIQFAGRIAPAFRSDPLDRPPLA